MDALAAVRLAVGTAFLAVAAMSDVRTRKVPDPLWIGLGTIGLALVLVELVLSPVTIGALALVGASAILFYAVFFGRPLFDEKGFHPRPMRLGLFGFAGVLVVWSSTESVGPTISPIPLAQLIAMPIMVLVYQGFYQIGLLHGGADAKGMIALALLLPAYPDASPFPLFTPPLQVGLALELVIPFSLVVLVDAAILYLAVPLGLLGLNAVRREVRLPQALFGYRADLDRLPPNVWLMERIDDHGDHVLVLMPRRGRNTAADARHLREAGIRRVWVQPKIPFMVPLALGLPLAFLVGNPLLLLFLF